MKSIILSFFFLAISTPIFGQSEEEAAIREALTNYIHGSSYNDPEQIVSAFYAEAPLFLSKEGQEIYRLSPSAYADLFKKREKGVFNGRVGNILSVDQEHNIATAKAEILIEAQDMRFIDLFLLKKLDGEWKIISKAATLIPKEEK